MIAVSSSDSSIFTTLRSLGNCQQPKYVGVEVFLIENGPKPSMKNVLDNFNLNIKYFYSPFPNKSKALNMGLSEISDNALVIFTDADIKFNTEFISSYYRIAQENTIGYYFGGPMEVEYEEMPESWKIRSLPTSAKGWKFDGIGPDHQTQYFLGCNWAAFSRDLKKTGGFNEQLGPGTKPRRTGQETDMQSRLRMNNINPLYISENCVSHYVPKHCLTIKWILRRKYQEGFSIGMGFHKGTPSSLTIIMMNLFKKILKMTFSIIFLSTDKKLYSVGLLFESIGRISGYIYSKKNRANIL